MSLKNNILSNYISQLYMTVIGILMVPMYVRYMGAEAYGLVGFYGMLQSWFQLLDIGLTPTLSREAARYQGGATDALSLRRLLRVLEGIFLGVAIIGCAAMIIGSRAIASDWLKVRDLPQIEVEYSIKLMALIVGLRWVCGLYRGALAGFEKIVWLSGLNIIISTARFVLVIPFLFFVTTKPSGFFSYQLAIALLEAVVLVIQTYRLMPVTSLDHYTAWQMQPLRKVLKFSLSIAITGTLWVLVTQSDKLILSKLITLTDYAYFAMAVMVAGGVGVISGPISGAILPRLTKLNAQEDEVGMISLYRSSTQLVAVIAIPTALVLAFFAEQVLWVWTGNSDIVHKVSSVLALYALGNGILALGAFPYYLQFAKGNLKLHLVGSALFVVLFLPALLLATTKYGMIGPGYAWFGTHAILFLFWLPFVHSRLYKGLHSKWLLIDVIPIVFVTVTVLCVCRMNISWPINRVSSAIRIIEVSTMTLMIAGVSSSSLRGLIRNKLINK